MNPIFQWIVTRLLKMRLHHCTRCGRMFYDRGRYPDEKAVCPDCKKK